MGGSSDNIVVDAEIDSKGFESGIGAMAKAVEKLNKTVQQMAQNFAEMLESLDWDALAEGLKSGDMQKFAESLSEAVKSLSKFDGDDDGGPLEEMGQSAEETAERTRTSLLPALKKVEATLKNIGGKVLNTIKRGFYTIESAAKRAVNAVKNFGRQGERSMMGVARKVKSLIPMIIGVGSAYGVISKAVSAFMSQNEQLSKQLSSVWTAFGNLLGPIITMVINLVTKATSYILAFFKLLGVTTKSASELSKKTNQANQAAKELQKTIAGFDELNILQDNSSDNGTGDYTLEDIDPSEWMKRLAELIKAKEWDEVGRMIAEKINSWIDILKAKGEEWGRTAGEWVNGVVSILYRAIKDIDWVGLGQALARFVNGLVEQVDFYKLGSLLVAKFTIAFQIVGGFLRDLKWADLGVSFTKLITGMIDSLKEAIDNVGGEDGEGYKKIGAGIRDFFKNIDWEEIQTSLGELLKEAWEAAKDILWGFLGYEEGGEEPPIIKSLEKLVEAAKTVAQTIADVWPGVKEKIGELLEWLIDEGLPGLLEDLADMIRDVARAFTEGDWSGFTENFNLLEQVLTAIVATKIITGLGDLVIGLGNLKGALDKLFPAASAAAGTGGAAAGGAGGGGLVALAEKAAAAAGEVTGLELVATAALPIFALLAVAGMENAKVEKEVQEALDGTGHSLDGLAELLDNTKSKMKPLTEELAQDGNALKEQRLLLDEYNVALAEFAAQLGISEDALRKYLEVDGNTAEQLADDNYRARELTNTQKEGAKAMAEAGASAKEIADAYLITEENAQKLIDDTANLKTKQDELTSSSGETKTGMEEEGKAADSAADDFGEMSTDVGKATEDTAKSVDEMSKDVQDAVSGMSEDVETSVSGMDEKVETTVSGMAKDVETSASEMKKETTDTVQEMGSDITTKFNEIKAKVTECMSSLKTSLNVTWGQIRTNTQTSCTLLRSDCTYTFTALARNAYGWGYDIMSNMASGIYAGSYLVTSAISYVASMIRSTIGFSEPETGPLSNFHTYMPDMMKLMREGILDNMDMPISAVNDVASGIEKAITGKDYSSLLSKIQSVGDAVSFQTPAVASGTVTPYSVSALTSSTGGTLTTLDDVISSINSLRSSLMGSMNGEGNQQISLDVYLDGRQLESAVTKRQQRTLRAKGLA